MRVFDVMTPDVQLCTPEDTVRDAAEAMGELDVGLLPVAEDNCLVGMISDRDIAIRAVGKGCGPDTKIRDVMTSGVKYCFDDQDIESVSWNMGDMQVRRLPVLSRQKRLVGIISLGDIARSQAGDVTAASLHQISQPERKTRRGRTREAVPRGRLLFLIVEQAAQGPVPSITRELVNCPFPADVPQRPHELRIGDEGARLPVAVHLKTPGLATPLAPGHSIGLKDSCRRLISRCS